MRCRLQTIPLFASIRVEKNYWSCYNRDRGEDVIMAKSIPALITPSVSTVIFSILPAIVTRLISFLEDIL